MAAKNSKVVKEGKNKHETKTKVVKKKRNIKKNERSLGDYMAELLKMPAEDAKKEELLANGYQGKDVNHALLLAQSVLDKAIEKGDVAAFKEVKALLEEESGEPQIPLEEMVKALCKINEKEKIRICGGKVNENGDESLDNNIFSNRNTDVVGDEAHLESEIPLEPE